MNDIVGKLASSSGISPEQAQKGLGTILGLLKSKLPAETYSKISAAVPDADGMVAASEEAGPESGGLLNAVTGAVGKLFGGGGDAVAKFSKLGFSAEQVQGFLPKVMEFLKGKLPPEVITKISGLLHLPEDATR